jgi:opacity protein-like surface antigen
MRVRNLILAGVVMAAVSLQAARAQDFAVPDKGDAEIGLSGYIDIDSDSEEETNVSLSYLPYWTRNIQAGASLNYFDVGDYSAWGAEIRADYNLVGADTAMPTVPYAGLALGYWDPDGADSQTGWGAQIGVKHFLSNNVSVFAEVRYRDWEDYDYTSLFFGLNAYLRKK